MCVCLCVGQHKSGCLAACVIEEEQQTNNPGAGALQKHADSRTRDKMISLDADTGTHPRYFAHVGGVVGEFVPEVFQGHPVAVRVQLLHVAFVFELALRC